MIEWITGLCIMRHKWQAVGHVEPVYRSGWAHKTFEMFLPDCGVAA
jgi:hypothetical protein